MKTLQEAIADVCKKEGKLKSSLTSLVLDSKCKATNLQESLSGFDNLEVLSLCNTNLGSLTGFPPLPKLRILRLSDNRIPGGHLEPLAASLSACPNLARLDLAGNAGFTRLDQLKPLARIKSLRSLELDGCPVKDSSPEFHTQIFAMLSGLEYLDNLDKNRVERDGDSEEEDDEEDDEDFDGEEAEDAVADGGGEGEKKDQEGEGEGDEEPNIGILLEPLPEGEEDEEDLEEDEEDEDEELDEDEVGEEEEGGAGGSANKRKRAPEEPQGGRDDEDQEDDEEDGEEDGEEEEA